jgi:hypothetical protein
VLPRNRVPILLSDSSPVSIIDSNVYYGELGTRVCSKPKRNFVEIITSVSYQLRDVDAIEKEWAKNQDIESKVFNVKDNKDNFDGCRLRIAKTRAPTLPLGEILRLNRHNRALICICSGGKSMAMFSKELVMSITTGKGRSLVVHSKGKMIWSS